jgi:hypothetical protein
MGIKNTKIMDFSNIICPDGYNRVKISSYNIDIKSTIGASNNTGEIKKKKNDIICIQGIHDFAAASMFITELKKYIQVNQLDNFYYSSPFDGDQVFNDNLIKRRSKKKLSNRLSYDFKKSEINEIQNEIDIENLKSSTSLRKNTTNTRFELNNNRSSNKSRNEEKIRSQNIIISRYPIIEQLFVELGDLHEVDDIIGIKTMIGANINIHGNIISLYNTELSDDIKLAHLLNNSVREKEISAIFNAIEENILQLAQEKYSKYVLTDIHLLIGSLNIPEKINEKDNDELCTILQKYHCVDLFRYMFFDDPGYTNSTNDRLNYIFMVFTEDMYDKKKIFYKKLQKVNTCKALFDLIFERYGLFFLDFGVYTNNIYHSFANYPVESVFMIKNNDT